MVGVVIIEDGSSVAHIALEDRPLPRVGEVITHHDIEDGLVTDVIHHLPDGDIHIYIVTDCMENNFQPEQVKETRPRARKGE